MEQIGNFASMSMSLHGIVISSLLAVKNNAIIQKHFKKIMTKH